MLRVDGERDEEGTARACGIRHFRRADGRAKTPLRSGIARGREYPTIRFDREAFDGDVDGRSPQTLGSLHDFVGEPAARAMRPRDRGASIERLPKVRLEEPVDGG